ncbi:MAG: hypothetical protein HW391_496 [Chloroflexi bacterium]|nr:hypothetical protein [Chloroflexota bacterium]
MPAAQIAANLAYINWTVLTGLAVGAYCAVVLGWLFTSATKGYLAFVAFTAAVFGLLAWLSDGALPRPEDSDLMALWDAAWSVPRTTALALFAVIALITAITIARAGLAATPSDERAAIPSGEHATSAPARGGRARMLAVGGVGVGLFVLFAAAASWGGSPLGTTLLFVQLAVLAAATGGVWASMILGHWYLVTPKLPEAPLVLFSRVLTGVVALQLILFVVWVGTGIGAAGVDGPGSAGEGGATGFGALTGPWALFVWLRLVVGIVFPLIVGWAAIQTARTRSMESATGLLYINVGTIAAGTILAAGLYFGAGLLV